MPPLPIHPRPRPTCLEDMLPITRLTDGAQFIEPMRAVSTWPVHDHYRCYLIGKVGFISGQTYRNTLDGLPHPHQAAKGFIVERADHESAVYHYRLGWQD